MISVHASEYLLSSMKKKNVNGFKKSTKLKKKLNSLESVEKFIWNNENRINLVQFSIFIFKNRKTDEQMYITISSLRSMNS